MKMSLHYLCLFAFIGIYVAVVCGREGCVRSRTSLSCPRRCTKFIAKRKCYLCKPGCTSVQKVVNNGTCNPKVSNSCNRSEICLPNVPAGNPTCVPRKLENKPCSDGDSLVNTDGATDAAEPNLFSKLFSKVPIKVRRLKKAIVPCLKGLFCKRISTSRHVCRNITESICMLAKSLKSGISCQKNGDFNPLQCTKRNGKKMCKCVTSNGTDIDGTEKEVGKKKSKPDCNNRKCTYLSPRGTKFVIPSRTLFVDSKKCRRCFCVAGENQHCTSLNETICEKLNALKSQRKHCQIRNKQIRPGASIGCKTCVCVRGKLQCLRGRCKKGRKPDLHKLDKCLACKGPRRPVCGNDGKTYPSACVAMNCRQLDSGDFTPGACHKKDVCRKFGCNGSEICVRKGGVTCLSRKGCSQSKRFRECVNLEELLCGNDQNQTSSEVCGSDGKTYASLCELLQASSGVKVKYGGKCNDKKCSSGEVCGTDGVTYSNVCELHTQSANARVDYRGKCVEISSDTSQDQCQTERLKKRCKKVSQCMTSVLPEDGCCPICGGGLTVGFDRDAFEDYLSLNPSVETVDDLLKRMILSGLITEKDLLHCDIKASLLNEGDLFLAFEALTEAEDYCMTLSKKIGDMINNQLNGGSGDDSKAVISPIPEEFQFAIVAETSPLVTTTTPGAVITAVTAKGGGQTCMKAVSFAGILTALVPVLHTL